MKSIFKDKKYLLTVLPLLGLTFCIIKHINLYPFLKTESYYYIFSTIAQCFGAILGLIGAYTIFMINSVDNRIFKIGIILLNKIRLEYTNEEFQQAKLDEYLKRPQIVDYFDKNKIFQGDKHEFLALKRYRSYLAYSGIYIAIVLCIIITFSLILLPFSESFIAFHNKFGMDLILIILLIAIFGLLETIIFIFDVFNVTDI